GWVEAPRSTCEQDHGVSRRNPPMMNRSRWVSARRAATNAQRLAKRPNPPYIQKQVGLPMHQPIYLTEADVAHLVTVKDAIAVLEETFALWHDPGTTNLPRQRAKLAAGSLNLMGAACERK